jgi:endonuclease YncB( thermonuclease family)
MRTLTRFVAAVVTAAVVPACSVIARSVAHADPLATTATVLKVVDGDTVDIVDDVRGRLRIRLLGIDTPEQVPISTKNSSPRWDLQFETLWCAIEPAWCPG